LTINVTYHDFLLTVLTLISVVGVSYLVVVLRKLSRFCDLVGGSVERVEPRLRKTLESAEATLDDSRAVIRNGRRVADDLASVASMARGLAEETAARIEMVLAPIRILSSLVVKGQELVGRVMERRRGSKEEDKEVTDGQE